jgi:hypothetical protein
VLHGLASAPKSSIGPQVSIEMRSVGAALWLTETYVSSINGTRSTLPWHQADDLPEASQLFGGRQRFRNEYRSYSYLMHDGQIEISGAHVLHKAGRRSARYLHTHLRQSRDLGKDRGFNASKHAHAQCNKAAVFLTASTSRLTCFRICLACSRKVAPPGGGSRCGPGSLGAAHPIPVRIHKVAG